MHPETSTPRVVHILATLGTGGAEKQVLNLAREALGRGHQHWVVPLRPRLASWPGFEDILSTRVYCPHFRWRTAPAGFRRLREWLTCTDPDVVQTHLVEGGRIGRIAAWSAHIPVVITTEHGLTKWKSWLDLAWERVALRWTDTRIAVSDEILQDRIQREKVPREKMALIPNGVPLHDENEGLTLRRRLRAEWGISESAFVLGYIGRFVPVKNVPALVRAFAQALGDQNDAFFLLAGDGEARGEIESLMSSLGERASRIRLLGAVPGADRIAPAFDSGVLFSIREGLPMAALEIMAWGVPLVTSTAGQLPRLLARGGGIPVPVGDQRALEDAFRRVHTDSEARRLMGTLARKTVQDDYSIMASFDKHLSLYRHLLAKKNAGGSYVADKGFSS